MRLGIRQKCEMPAPVSTAPPASSAGGRHRLQLRAEQQTLVIPLYAKALDFRAERSVLNDRRSSEIVDLIDFNFESVKSRGGGLLVLRARQLDDWIREFLGKQPNAVVLNLGCGLDTRITRLNPLTSVSWFDIDFPEVIDVRRNFYSDRDGYRMVGCSITQPEWLEQIPRHRPVIVVADGVLEYVAPSDVEVLLNRVTDNFHHGQIVFDVLNSYALRAATERIHEHTGATLRWAVDDPREIVALDPKLRNTAALPLLASKFLPRRYKLVYAISFLFPRIRKSMRVLRFEF
jgi:O-methyltransferase involved in polyketide biosynthesis